MVTGPLIRKMGRLSRMAATKAGFKQGFAFVAYVCKRYAEDRCLGIAAFKSMDARLREFGHDKKRIFLKHLLNSKNSNKQP